MKFFKMQATGNDFVLIDARGMERDWSKLAISMCQPHFGVGADGLLLLLPSQVADFRMRMFNPDGSEAEACGNGLRCLTKYVVEKGIAKAKSQGLTVETVAGIRNARPCVESRKVTWVEVSMGSPRFKPEEIPVLIEDQDTIVDYPLNVGGKELRLAFVSLGNPHAICFLHEPVEDFPLAELGAMVEYHPLFPQRMNFEVANILSRSQIEVRVWERGAGETLGCGSGACAVAVAARLHGWADNQVDIMLPGGVLTVEWEGNGEVWLKGPAEMVFEGEWLEPVPLRD